VSNVEGYDNLGKIYCNNCEGATVNVAVYPITVGSSHVIMLRPTISGKFPIFRSKQKVALCRSNHRLAVIG
jgi:hypothetical protein